MSQHYTKNTIETSAWCNKCGKMTAHTVSDRRLGYCIPCYQKPLSEAKVAEEPKQMGFESMGGEHEDYQW